MECSKCGVMLSDYEMAWYGGLCQACYKKRELFSQLHKNKNSQKPRRFLKN